MTNKITTNKPWGHEVLWAETPNYAGKLLHISPGHRLSLQYHAKKEETVYVLVGQLKVWHSKEDEDFTLLSEADTFHVEPNQVPRFGAPEDQEHETILIDVSTNFLEDVVRLADDYKRDA